MNRDPYIKFTNLQLVVTYPHKAIASKDHGTQHLSNLVSHLKHTKILNITTQGIEYLYLQG